MKEKRGRIIFNTIEKKMYLISDSYIKKNIGFKNQKLIKYLSESENYCVFLDRNKSLLSNERVPHYWTLNTDGKWLWSADLDYYTINYGLKWPKDFVLQAKTNNHEIKDISEEDFDEIKNCLDEIRFDFGENKNVEVIKL